MGFDVGKGAPAVGGVYTGGRHVRLPTAADLGGPLPWLPFACLLAAERQEEEWDKKSVMRTIDEADEGTAAAIADATKDKSKERKVGGFGVGGGGRMTGTAPQPPLQRRQGEEHGAEGGWGLGALFVDCSKRWNNAVSCARHRDAAH